MSCPLASLHFPKGVIAISAGLHLPHSPSTYAISPFLPSLFYLTFLRHLLVDLLDHLQRLRAASQMVHDDDREN